MFIRPLFIAILTCFFSYSASYAQESSSDASDYLDLLNKLKTIPIEQQVSELQQYLQKNPESTFKSEIEKNISNLNKFMNQTNPERQKDEKDTELYLKAVALSKTLPEYDQIKLWEQFLRENPTTLYKKDILYKLQDLRFKQPKKATPKPTSSAAETPKASPVVRDLPYKDTNKALLYAIFPGLLVPGIAHWYTHDYIIAGTLTAFRIAGLAIGVPAFIRRDQTPFNIGLILTGFSYLADIVDAPFTVERYNDDLEKKNPLTFSVSPSSVLLSYRF